jgi:molybdate transport system substrate-binding protein
MSACVSRRRLLALSIAVVIATGLAPPAPAATDDVIVFAAASLKNALDDAVERYGQVTGRTVLVSYAATSTLAKQIEQAAPADIFFAADMAWMDYLEERAFIRPDTRHTLLGNRIVLIAPRDSDATVDIVPGMDLTGLMGDDGLLATANTDSVPAGKYAEAALQTLHAWDAVSDRIAQADNVRNALAFVARGEAPLGIVYRTDAAAELAVRVIGVFPDNSHPAILYPIAITADSTNPEAGAFLEFLLSPAARPAFEGQGFTVIDPVS